MHCSEMGLEISDEGCLALIQQQPDGPTIIILLLLLLFSLLTSLCELSIKD